LIQWWKGLQGLELDLEEPSLVETESETSQTA